MRWSHFDHTLRIKSSCFSTGWLTGGGSVKKRICAARCSYAPQAEPIVQYKHELNSFYAPVSRLFRLWCGCFFIYRRQRRFHCRSPPSHAKPKGFHAIWRCDMNREGKKWVLYPRVSTEMQIVGIHEDADKSGKSIEGRPAFKKCFQI